MHIGIKVLHNEGNTKIGEKRKVVQNIKCHAVIVVVPVEPINFSMKWNPTSILIGKL